MNTAIVIDDHRLFAGGFSHMLRSLDGIDQVDCFQGPDAALERSAIDLAEDEVVLIVSDLYIPGFDMFSWFGTLKKTFPSAPLVIVSSSISRTDRSDSLAAGANLYIEKHADPSLVIEGLTGLLAKLPLKDDFLDRTAVDAQQLGLTNKQIDILVHLARGLSTKEIALRFDISTETVKSHLTRIYEIIGQPGRSAASNWAQQHGLL